MAGATSEITADGTLVLDTPVTLPDVLDILVVGGGPFGTATAFRAKERGLSALVIDMDDLMARIRDYAKDKPIVPDFGGGDSMDFPRGGALVSSLQFEEIDKDVLCERWKTLYRKNSVPARIGIELIGLEKRSDLFEAQVWNSNIKGEQRLRARHVVLGCGRGVPRRLDIPGQVELLAFSLKDAATFVGAPACVVGGGTSAAEAVIAISNAKRAAKDASAVYWSYRKAEMPTVSRALSEKFFDAFIVNGNVRYLPTSEPMAVLQVGNESCLAVRTARTTIPDGPTQTTQYEFKTGYAVACIGADVPEQFLEKIGTPLVTGGPQNKKRVVVTAARETIRPNLYLAGDVLSPLYFEAANFDGDPAAFKEVKRRGNIKAALQDGVLVADVIAEKLAGRSIIEVQLEPASGAASRMPSASPCTLVLLLRNGVEVSEYRLKGAGVTTIGRNGADIAFPEDDLIADVHAAVIADDAGYVVEDRGSAQGVFVQPASTRVVELDTETVLRIGQQWLVLGGRDSPTSLTHFNSAGQRCAAYPLAEGTTIVGRESPGITIAPNDAALSRRHLAVTLKLGRLAVRDLGSMNGTQLKVRGRFRLGDGDRVFAGRQVLRFDDERRKDQPSTRVTIAARSAAAAQAEPARAEPRPAARPVAEQTVRKPEPVPPKSAGPVVIFSDGRRAPCTKGQTILEAAKKNDIRIRYECGVGQCGIDPVEILGGCEALNEIGNTERDVLEDLCSLQPGRYRLACMARVIQDATVSINVVNK